ncbi:hypothetical protein CA51_26380 [Rosistilla oblonga]|nr:hypothetical protein CA51_26380 [Rosistilla oblonga]
MTDFNVHTIESAPQASKPQLEHSQKTIWLCAESARRDGGIASVVGSLPYGLRDL